MKRKITGLLLLLITIVGVVFGITKVNAESYQGTIKEGAWIPGYWISKKNGSTISYHQARWLNNSEGEAIYCIQPYVGIVDGTTYTITNEDMQILAGLSQDQWQMVTRLAYYGYGYNENGYNHSDAKWYVATQMLIWRTVDPARANDMYFTNGLNGTRNDSVLVSEMNEVKALAESHAARPNLSVPSEAIIGNEFNVSDSNGVLNKFRVTNVTGGTASINNNTLYVNPTEVGDMKITLSREANMAHKTIYLYFATSSQNLMRRGDLDPININLNVKVLGGKVTINKEDKVTKEPQGEATLKGATYGIYDETGTLIEKITTGDDGKVTSGYLPKLGKFYLQEISPSEGYKLDNTKYDFEITKDSLEPSVTVKEEVIENHFNYVKVYASDETGVMTPEENVDFAVYNKNNELVMNLTTDKDGIINFKLPYGTYTLRQMTSPKSHKKMDDLTLTVTKADVKINKVISNGEYKAKLRVVKIDKETKEVIKRAGIKFKILDTKTNEYVCQTTSYPKATICEFETDKNGEFITPFVLNSGTYKLEEVDQKIDGYLWNKESHEFTIDEDANLRTDSEYGVIFDTDFENQRVKGEIKIEKVGNNVQVAEEGLILFQEPLEGIKFCVFTKDGKEVKCGTTDSEGHLTFKDLELGEYYVQEIETLENYVLDQTKHEITLKYKDQYTPVITYETILENHVPTGKLEFTKTDFSESKTLPNTTIEIYSENDILIYSGKTDENGKIVIDKLPIGKFYILEKEAPEGYKLNEEKMWFEIKEDGEVIKATMKDEQIIDVPDTEKNKDYKELIGGIALMLIGTGVVIYGIKRNKKNK